MKVQQTNEKTDMYGPSYMSLSVILHEKIVQITKPCDLIETVKLKILKL